MKVVRASRGIFVPHDPENPNKNALRLVQKGLITLIPDDYKLPDDSYEEMGRFNIKKKDKKED